MEHLQKQQPWHSWPMKPEVSTHQRLNPHPGSPQLFISYSITMVTTLPLSSILNWKMWILVPVLPASNMMQYWWVGAPNGGLGCSGFVQPARRPWSSRWASSLAASRWCLTNVRYVSRKPRKMKTPVSFGTFITTHSLSFPVDRQELAHFHFTHFYFSILSQNQYWLWQTSPGFLFNNVCFVLLFF